MNTLITVLIVIGVIAAIIAVLVLVIKSKINSAAQNYLGMNAGEAAKLLSQGLKDEVTLPKAISNLTAVYAPKIKRDFPEMGLEGMDKIARNSLLASFNAIELGSSEKADTISDASDKLKNQLKNTITDNISRGINVRYDDITIHKSGVASYKNDGKAAGAVFEISLGCIHSEKKGSELVNGSDSQPEQSVYEVYLSYNQDEYLDSSSVVYTSTCPNCGAPVSASGSNKICKYCGSGLHEIADRIWQCDGFRKTK